MGLRIALNLKAAKRFEISMPRVADSCVHGVSPSSSIRNTFNISSQEIQYLKYSWERASSASDIGCELVARLLNDNRTRFRALIESHSGHLLGSSNFTADDVKKFKRARAVASGVVMFFNQVISKLDEPDAADKISLLSQSLGASHFRMKVWFQAENWLCVKNCLLDAIMTALRKNGGSSLLCGKRHMHNIKRATDVWYKVIQFVIQNMKRGFLAEALTSDSSCNRNNK
uniref:GLOBIN domain-containing protein n=1 Tax=Heterorhabditis bacteriophora TaxID=37862 RepID=A0A1I7W801_HETBA